MNDMDLIAMLASKDDDLKVQAAVPPLSAANIQVWPFSSHTAGAENNKLPEGVDTICNSPPICGSEPVKNGETPCIVEPGNHASDYLLVTFARADGTRGLLLTVAVHQGT